MSRIILKFISSTKFITDFSNCTFIKMIFITYKKKKRWYKRILNRHISNFMKF